MTESNPSTAVRSWLRWPREARIFSLALCSLVGASCAASAGPKPAEHPSTAQRQAVSNPEGHPAGEPPRGQLPKAEWLPEEVREMLSERMQRHGREMMFLLMDVVILAHDETAREADAIAAEPRFGRPTPGEQGTISALLPARFFDLEDELRAHASALADAARANDDTRLVKAYGRLTETCVGCHTVYLNAGDSDASSGD